mmetsp:Transcript_10284/g.17891  ORF Transcript_10284/g.17891 Transcript_10284/m.17891 type:complete len:428 (+) Transcript_10284:176-1459(+)|eukprot:CAMPEP_0119104466 /NCGR_PEP_ID=MMETSP1180-20130426/2668_1 /TAXON_ID=3052 ORGANISM="Chlamydomonas cf sp, Strain CCMP681" /NCGR_SAMPLE_ID=MMETSP1180 /ASSEMBLY_ACC=CAM_ASM_000741 /LENGTH=427 /DNA_ID=CAMNT_0007089233 /DNA_START=176 /DNA_END=1459 /DNA_ORIENTATION=-
MGGKNKVAYYYDSDFEGFYYGPNHPMKPHRMSMAHQLLLGYGLHEHMDVYKCPRADPAQLAQFHSPDFVEFLSQVSPDNMTSPSQAASCLKFNINDDNPVFEGLYDWCQLYAGASIEGAQKLCQGQYDIAINWSGGLHHAKKDQASGFCYVNDLVLAILELLRHHSRVLYIDIDVHHGDGVEEAFYLTDRVMTVSFHRWGDFFFPSTGALADVGELNGRFYSVNVPLKEGTTDDTFHGLFKPIMRKVMEVFQPGAIVLQCGADSLSGDRLGCFNLSIKGHGEAVRFMKEFNVPMLVTGGGGYIKTNVAKCWTYETSILTGQTVSSDLPRTQYHEYFGPDFSLFHTTSSYKPVEEQNKREEVEKLKQEVMEHLRQLAHTPSVQMHHLPPNSRTPEYQVDEEDTHLVDRMGKYAREHALISSEFESPWG